MEFFFVYYKAEYKRLEIWELLQAIYDTVKKKPMIFFIFLSFNKFL
jgi:hypothetical protein